jgi:hypothetical protein
LHGEGHIRDQCLSRFARHAFVNFEPQHIIRRPLWASAPAMT